MKSLVRTICKGSLFAFALGVSNAALAADWTRYYGGLSLSSQNAKADWTTTGLGASPFSFPITTDPAQDLGPSGWRYGVYGGKNWKLADRWVAGIDLSLGNGDETRSLPGTPGWSGSQSDTLSVTSKWNGSIDARLGYIATPDVLVFGTLGWAWQRFDGRFICPGNATSWCIASRDEAKSWTRDGWEYGVGVEWSFSPRWTARADYREARLGSESDVWFASAPIDAVASRLSFKTRTVNLGVAYQF